MREHSDGSCHTLPDSVNGRPKDNKKSIRSYPFAWVSCMLLVKCPFHPTESFVHAQNLERIPPHRPEASAGCTVIVRRACVLVGTRAFPVLYLSVRIRFLIGGPDTRPDFYLIINGWTKGVPDIDRMCNGQLPTGNAWKLMNNGCV